MSTETPKLLTAQEAADWLKMSRGALDVLRSRGGGPRYIKRGSRVFYDPADIIAWLESHKVTPGRTV